MKLFFNQIELNADVENIINAPKDGFGFTVKVKFKDDTLYKGSIRTYFNVTEIHSRFPSVTPYFSSDSIALESDIHSTGSTPTISEIESVNIFLAHSKADNY